MDFSPFRNPVGFGASDFVELAFAVLLVAMVWFRSSIVPGFDRLAKRTGWCMLLLGLLPIALRLALLSYYPIPTPGVSDDFSYVLLADTLRHFRLANPPHPMHRFFETVFVLQEPTYSSIFPLGQGIAIALGWTIFGHPWAGVALSIGGLCALCYWMLRAWTTPSWALIGGLLAVAQFGPINQWMNSYWGGAVSAIAGCLIFGSLPRLGDGRAHNAVLLGAGMGLQMLTRPYEAVFVGLGIVLFFVRRAPSIYWRAIAIAIGSTLPALGLVLLQNRAVTRSWTTLPYMLSRYQYGVPASFTFEPNPTPHRELTPVQELDYQVQSSAHGRQAETVVRYLARLASRFRFLRFFFYPPLYLALPFFVLALREWRFVWVTICLALLAIGTTFYPYFYSHYIAAATCLFVLLAVTGLDRLSQWRPEAARLILFLCGAHFLFWYGLHLFGGHDFAKSVMAYETWDAINQDDPQGRLAVARQLAASPGKQLVFVRYSPEHRFEEWVNNTADIDQSRVVWARDLGADEDAKLRQYYPDRQVWLLEPDYEPPKLGPYSTKLEFEQVR